MVVLTLKKYQRFFFPWINKQNSSYSNFLLLNSIFKKKKLKIVLLRPLFILDKSIDILIQNIKYVLHQSLILLDLLLPEQLQAQIGKFRQIKRRILVLVKLPQDRIRRIPVPVALVRLVTAHPRSTNQTRLLCFYFFILLSLLLFSAKTLKRDVSLCRRATNKAVKI